MSQHQTIATGILPVVHASAFISPDPASPSTENPAVARCVNAYRHAFFVAQEQKQSTYEGHSYAQFAFRDSLPPLAGEDNIRDFIACVGQGILIHAIESSEGTRLLYAAQVAYQACHKPAKAPSRGPGRPRTAGSAEPIEVSAEK